MYILDGKKLCITKESKNNVIDLVRHHGIIVLRNYDVNVEKFSKFIGLTCSRVTNDPARKASSENAQLIDAGNMEMGPHLENGNAPFIPDLQFFYSEYVPDNSSRTSYSDGYEAYKLLSEDTIAKLSNREIMYTREVPKDKADKYFMTELNTADAVQISSNISKLKGFQAIEKDKNYLQWRIRRKIVYKSSLSGLPVLAHSLTGPSINYDIPFVTWSDGGMISPLMLHEIIKVSYDVAKPIPYKSGDVVVIDNHRVMHGREKITNASRKIYGGQGYI